jgi:RHS repeat-associated protein
MKRTLICAIVLFITFIQYTAKAQTGSSYLSPINFGVLHSGCSFGDLKTNSSANGFNNTIGQPSNDIWYMFTLNAPMTVNISNCGSSIDTYLHLLDGNRTEIQSNDDFGPLCSSEAASMTATLPAGTYYVVSEGYDTNIGNIVTAISIPDNSGFSYANRVDAGEFGPCQPTNFIDFKATTVANAGYNGEVIIYYTFTVTSTGNITISNAGSTTTNTYIILYDIDGTELEIASPMQITLTPGKYLARIFNDSEDPEIIKTEISSTSYPTVSPAGANMASAVDLGTITAGNPVIASYTPSVCYEPYQSGQAYQKYYKFTVTNNNTLVTISNCSSVGSGYFINLYDISGALITNASMAGPVCPGTNQASIVQTLNAGTYYTGIPGYLQSNPIITSFSIPSPAPVNNCVALLATPSADQNYVTTYIPRQPFTDPSVLASKNTCEVMQSIQYLDGLGRPLQSVQVKGNQDGTKDIIAPIAYDQFGREATKYLPYTTASGIPGSYRSDALAGASGGYLSSAQYGFYQPQPNQNYTPISTPMAGIAFEASPLNRVIEQGAPGDPWQLTGSANASNIPAGHTSKTIYVSNDGIIYWAKQFDVAIDPVTGARSLIDKGSYSPNQLYVTITMDENWTSGKPGTAEEYKDKEGHVVLKRMYNNNNNGTPETLSTYYVYDDFGNLCYVLPPKAEADNLSSSNVISQAVMDNLCYQYTYDARQRLISKRIPGKDWEYIVYNKLNRIVATTDGNMLDNEQWLVTKYDALGRTIITGVLTNSLDRDGLQQEVNTNSAYLWESRTPGNDHTNLSWPTVPINILTKNYYDDYNIPNMPYNYQTGKSIMTRGSVTAHIATVLGNSNSNLWTVNYYDDKGRATDIYAEHYFKGYNVNGANTGNYDHINNTYNFNDQLIASTREHYNIQGGTLPLIKVLNTYHYDHMGRKVQTFEQINTSKVSQSNIGTTTGANVMISQLNYNELGQIGSKYLHSTNGTDFMQAINYSYNERGWLTQINDPALPTTVNKLFSLKLNYNLPQFGAVAQYNGNITEQQFTTPSSSNSKYFTYAYDKLNRLTDANSSSGTNLTENNINYDKGGNITQLTRNGALLSYTYLPNTNQLASLSGLINTYNDMYYDRNGNMIDNARPDYYVYKDYNILNLPWNNDMGTSVLGIIYSSEGQKLISQNYNYDNNQLTTTDYIKGIQYDRSGNNFKVTSIQTEEGQAVPDGNGGFKYEYVLKDHLGNNRVVFDLYKGAPRPIQVTNYFAFGLSVLESVIGDKNEYLYNGKELMEGENQYDYGARFYDPVIARWTSVDPLAEKFRRWSTYNYCDDNPVRFVDPDGMGTQWIPKVVNDKLTLAAEKGDNAQTLAKTLNIDQKKADQLFKTKDANGNVKLTNDIPGVKAINGAISDVKSNPDNYGDSWHAFLTTPENYNCFESALDISSGKTPNVEGQVSGDKFDAVVESNSFKDVTGETSNYKFGSTVVAFGDSQTEHAATYLGTSKDGTQYTWSKGGIKPAPKVETVPALKTEYGKNVKYYNKTSNGSN